MWFRMHRLDIDYGVTLAEPVFELSTMGHKVFAEFYRALNPRFPTSLADLKVSQASTYEDFSYVIDVFGENGTLRIGAQGLSAAFRRLSSEEHLKLISDCIALSEEALRTILPESRLKDRKFNVLSWLKCEGGAEAVKDLLQRHGSQGIPIGVGDFAIEDLDYRLGTDFTNKSEGWAGKLALEMSALLEADLYYRIETAYLDNSHYSGLESQIAHTRQLYFDILRRFELEPAEATDDG